MSNIIVDENGMRSTVYDVIELPNKGMIYLDSKAYDVLMELCNSIIALDGSKMNIDNNKTKWKTTITFTNNNIEYAIANETTKREYR